MQNALILNSYLTHVYREENGKMRNGKPLTILLTVILLTSFLTVTIAPAFGKGSSKGKDVWWYKNVEPGMGTWKAIIYRTRGGIVHEWRYELNGEPVDVHLVYKPVEKFPNQPHGKNWVHWTFDDRYEDLPGDEADLTDFFTKYDDYWVHFNPAEY
jgi:hypothetical protein